MENNIHNDFFVTILKDKQNAIDFLSEVLPENIVSQINFNFLEYDDTSYIQSRFKDLFSDIVIKTKINHKNTDIFVLIEHKSSLPDKNGLFLQVLSYIYSMFEEDYKNNRDFRIVIPLVFYHGERKWDIPSNFLDLFDISDDIKQFLLNFSYILFNTENFNENRQNTFHNNLLLISSLIALKTAFNKKDIDSVIKIIENLNKLGILNDFKRIEIFLIYILKTKNIDEKEIAEIISRYNEEGGKTMLTFEDYFTEKGKIEGKIEGKTEGKIEDKQETLIRQLLKKFGIIDEEKLIIEKCSDPVKLDKALDEIIFAKSKEDVFRWVK